MGFTSVGNTADEFNKVYGNFKEQPLERKGDVKKGLEEYPSSKDKELVFKVHQLTDNIMSQQIQARKRGWLQRTFSKLFGKGEDFAIDIQGEDGKATKKIYFTKEQMEMLTGIMQGRIQIRTIRKGEGAAVQFREQARKLEEQTHKKFEDAKESAKKKDEAVFGNREMTRDKPRQKMVKGEASRFKSGAEELENISSKKQRPKGFKRFFKK